MKHTPPKDSYDKTEEPLDPATERVQRKMKMLLFISTSTMGLGFVAVLFAIIYRLFWADGSAPANVPNQLTLSSPIAAQERVVSAEIGDDDVTLVLDGPQCVRILVLDPIFGTIKRERLLPRSE